MGHKIEKTLVPECFKDDNTIRPMLTQKPLHPSSPKLVWVIMSRPLPLCKISSEYSDPFSPRTCENVHQVTRPVFLGGFTINTSNDVVSHKDVPFACLLNKISHSDFISPDKGNSGPIFDRT